MSSNSWQLVAILAGSAAFIVLAVYRERANRARPVVPPKPPAPVTIDDPDPRLERLLAALGVLDERAATRMRHLTVWLFFFPLIWALIWGFLWLLVRAAG